MSIMDVRTWKGKRPYMLKKMYHVMQKLNFKLAVNQTYIGRIQKGFDFLGYRFNYLKTVQNFLERITKLYEQGADKKRVRLYVQRWCSVVCYIPVP